MQDKRLANVLERVRTWPVERQEEAARLLEAMEHSGSEIYKLTDAERREIDEGLGQAKRGEFVPDAEMEAFWLRHDS